jgi:hypothetical protein
MRYLAILAKFEATSWQLPVRSMENYENTSILTVVEIKVKSAGGTSRKRSNNATNSNTMFGDHMYVWNIRGMCFNDLGAEKYECICSKTRHHIYWAPLDKHSVFCAA